MNDYLTVKELAELLRIKERKVYDLAASGEVPCSKAMGKLLFSRKAIESWLADNTTGPDAGSAQPRPDVLLGSHDPLLEWAMRESRCGLAARFDSSLDGLEKLEAGAGMASGLHVRDAQDGSWNIGAVRDRFASAHVVMVHWAKRQRGLILAPGLESAVQGLRDLTNSVFVVPRQSQAGSQILLSDLLHESDVSHEVINWTTPALSEQDAALMVAEDKAGVTFGLAAVAAQYRLPFVPIIEEHYDLLVDRRAWFDPPFQTLLGFCLTDAFMRRAVELQGYDVSQRFAVRFNAG